MPRIKDFQVSLTYRCNLACKWCFQFVGYLDFENTDISLEALVRGAKALREAKCRIRLLRVSGGEPTLHPWFEECCHILKKRWDPHWLWVCTNGTNLKPRGLQYREAPSGFREKHQPFMLSPVDLGMESERAYHAGDEIPCDLVAKCGRLFDVFGFSFCIIAGGLGRILRVDPYGTSSLSVPNEAMCRHCIFSLHREARERLFIDVAMGAVEHPSATYRQGLGKEPFRMRRYLERCRDTEE
jgi:hypothetical protein